MFGNSAEETFVNDINSDQPVSRGPSFWPLILVIMLGIAAFVVWASMTELEEVTSAEGRVIPSGQIQVVQTLEGGIVREILVQEGDLVEAGDILIRIDDTGFSSQLGELYQQETALSAERFRLNAERNFQSDLEFPNSFVAENPIAVAAEKGVFLSRRNQLLNELDVLENRLNQREAELEELQAQERKLVATLAPLEREAELTNRLVKRGVSPEIEGLRIEGRLAEMQGELEINRASQRRVAATVAEAKNLIQTTRNNYQTVSQERLAKLEAELAVIKEGMRAAMDRVTRSSLRSPAKGVVNAVNITTVGAVVQPGSDIIEIVPVDDGLLVEAKIRPQDVAFIKPNEAASVKLTAYDYLIYGDLPGKVVRIGADTQTDPEGEEFYRVIIRTDSNQLGEEGEDLPVIPGMVASVDIKTGVNTVMSYLMKPVLRASREGLRER